MDGEVAFAEMPVVAFYPCGERIFFVDYGIACHLYAEAAQHPPDVAGYECGIAYAEGVGMLGSHFDYSFGHKRERHPAASIALPGGEGVFIGVFSRSVHLFGGFVPEGICRYILSAIW